MVYKPFYGTKEEYNEVKDMKEIIIILMVVGLLLAGTMCSIQDVCDQEIEDIDFSGDRNLHTGDGTAIDGGGGSGSGPAPG